MHKDTDAKNGAESYPPMPATQYVLALQGDDFHSGEVLPQAGYPDYDMRGEVWRWQADGTDNLETMGNRMGVLIYAGELRNLLAAARAGAQAVPSDAIWLRRCRDGGIDCRVSDAVLHALPSGEWALIAPGAPAAVSVPEGWKLVPVQPTDAMLDATYAGQHCSDVYRDMLAAAPQAPAGEGSKA